MLSINTGLGRNKSINNFIIHSVLYRKNWQVCIFFQFFRLYHFKQHFTLECCRCFFRCSEINIHNILKCTTNLEWSNIYKAVYDGLSTLHRVQKSCDILFIFALSCCQSRILSHALDGHLSTNLVLNVCDAAYLAVISVTAAKLQYISWF